MKTIKMLSIVIILVVFICGCVKNDKIAVLDEEEIDESRPVLKAKLNFEINEKYVLSDLLSIDNKIELINGNDTLDTSSLGVNEVIIKYKEKEEEKVQKVNIKVIDTTKPIIKFNKEISTEIGKKIDLLKNVKVTDNSLEKIKAKVEGNYDFNKEGTYRLKYVAKDSSNNIIKEEFVLKVNKISVKKLGKNEYIRVKDGRVHKYTFVYSDRVTCDKNIQEGTPFEHLYPDHVYQSLGCEEIKDIKGKSYWGIYYMKHIDNPSSIFYY